MGTSWQVSVLLPSASDGPALQQEIAGILERIEASMSHFREDSELCRFSRLAAGERLTLSDEFAWVLRGALRVAGASDGAFDPTLGQQIEAWGFGAGPRVGDAGFCLPPAAVPSGAAWQALLLDEDNGLRQPGGVNLNLSAIAKGFAVDAVSDWLSRKGYAHHLTEVGGELKGVGMKPDLQPWWVALELPAPECPLPATRVALHGLAVATSGDYRRRYMANGRYHQHTLDPRNGAPVAHNLASVTVVHEECMVADAWATAIMVLGADAGLRLAQAQDLCALLQWRDARGVWREATSPAFSALLKT